MGTVMARVEGGLEGTAVVGSGVVGSEAVGVAGAAWGQGLPSPHGT